MYHDWEIRDGRDDNIRTEFYILLTVHPEVILDLQPT
jgi:hypothetical protein